MATYSKPSFDAALYLKFRPSYPIELFDLIYQYHANQPGHPSWDVALDIGCGPGIVTSVLANKFDTVFGVDPSLPMLDEARKDHSATLLSKASFGDEHTKKIHYFQSYAEDLSTLADNSVDLITAGQAAHWFDYERAWPEMSRVLKKGGTVALWCYGESRFPRFPKLTELTYEFYFGGKSLRDYWDNLESVVMCANLADLLPSPPIDSSFDLSTMKRLKFDGVNEPIILEKKMSWESIGQMMRTLGAVFNYLKAHPDDTVHQDGDLAARFTRQLKLEANNAGLLGNEVEVNWALGLVLIKK